LASVSANVFKAKKSLTFLSATNASQTDSRQLFRSGKRILTTAVTNTHFAPLHRPLFGQIPSQPRRFSSAKSAFVTSGISDAE
jgi:hypothetical protein